MSDEQDPTPPAPPSTDQPAPPKTADEIADSWYDPRGMYESDLRSAADRWQDETGASREERDEVVTQAAEAFADARINPGEASTLFSELTHFLAKPASDEQRHAWEVEARKALRERWGDDAPRRLEAVRQFIAARPELAKHLAESGYGSNPRLVLRLVESPHVLRMKPREPKK